MRRRAIWLEAKIKIRCLTKTRLERNILHSATYSSLWPIKPTCHPHRVAKWFAFGKILSGCCATPAAEMGPKWPQMRARFGGRIPAANSRPDSGPLYELISAAEIRPQNCGRNPAAQMGPGLAQKAEPESSFFGSCCGLLACILGRAYAHWPGAYHDASFP